jgi:hypothetical protein
MQTPTVMRPEQDMTAEQKVGKGGCFQPAKRGSFSPLMLSVRRKESSYDR